MTECNNLLKFVFSVLISFIFTSAVFAAMPEQSPRPVSQKAQAIQERRQQLEQDAADAESDIETEYAKWVALINSGQTPDDANVNAGLKFIARNRKFLPILNKQQKGDIYSALSAWVYYFDDKPDKALKQIISAYKLTPQNTKIVKTYFALSLIYRNYTPLAEILAAQETLPSVGEPQILQDSPYQQPSGAELNFDISRIRTELLGKIFDIPAGIPDQNSGPSDKKLTCLLLWKLDPNELEKFAAAPAPAPVQQPPAIEQTADSPPAAGEEEISETVEYQEQIYEPQEETHTKLSENEMFSQLQAQFAKNTEAVFAGINFNAPAKAKNLENWLAKNPQQWQSVPPSAELQQAVTSFIGSAPDKPMLLIISPNSAVGYLGNIDSFLPAMIISNILANPQDFADSNEPNQPPKLPKTPVIDDETVDELPTPTEPEPVKIQQPPAVKEISVPPAPVQETPPPAPAKTQIDEDFFDPRAETLIEHARAFFKISNRLQHHTYSKPIEMCRTVIKDYPNTKYVEQARTLMRQVPERFRERFDITDEELGL